MKYIIFIIVIYLTLIIHELGHCILPRLFGYKSINKIIFGSRGILKEINILGLSIEIRKCLFPIGKCTNKTTNTINLDELTFLQRTSCHLGGVIFNFLMAFGLLLILRKYTNIWQIRLGIIEIFNQSLMFFMNGFKNIIVDIENNFRNLFIYSLVRINSFIFVANVLPLPLYIKDGIVVFTDGGQFITFLLATYMKYKNPKDSL